MWQYKEALHRIREAERAGAEVLDLGGLWLEELPPELGRLTRLRVLALGLAEPQKDKAGGWVWSRRGGTHSGFTDLEVLRTLTGLQELDLTCCSRLLSLDALRALPGLTYLGLSECREVRDFKPLRALPGLIILNLSSCHQLAELEFLQGMSRLRSLDVSRCEQLSSLQPLCDLTKLVTLTAHYCRGLKSIEPLSSLTSLTELDLSWCGELGRFGPLAALLPSLRGLNLEGSLFDDLPPEVYAGSVDPSTTTPYFDNIIDQVRAHYADLQRGGRGDTELKVFVLGNGRVGTDAPILVVQAQCDTDADARPLPCPLPRDFAHVRTLAVSSRTGLGLAELRGALTGAVERLFRQCPPPPIGVGRIEVRRQLREMAAARRTLTRDEFRALCARVRLPTERGLLSHWLDSFRRFMGWGPPLISDPEALISFLHESGIVFSRPGMFNGQVVLDQTWALDAIYTLLHREKVLPALTALFGRFTVRDLRQHIWRDKSPAECDTLLGMMLSCGICFEVGRQRTSTGWSETEYVAPELLPPWSDSLLPMFRLLRSNPDFLGFELRYPFLHEGILRGFLSRLGTLAGNSAVYWKFGCWFYESWTKCDVFIDSRWEGDGPSGRISVKAWGDEPEDMLRRIHSLLADHRMAVGPDLPIFHNFAGFDKGRNNRPPGDRPMHPSAPDPRTVGRQVFLSYAWGDDTPNGQMRDQAADGVIAALTEVGYAVTFDKKDTRNGSLIDDFIRRIGRAENVVAILSDKYLRSEWCVKELYYVYTDCKGDDDAFLRRLHPVILSDAGLHDAAWARYREHWERKRDENNATFGNSDAGRVLRGHEIEHWIRILPTVLGLIRKKRSDAVLDERLDDMTRRVLQLLGESTSVLWPVVRHRRRTRKRGPFRCCPWESVPGS